MRPSAITLESGSLYKGDCLDLMQQLPDASVDMVLCDLPYGVTRNQWDAAIPLDLLWASYRRIVKQDGAIVLFAAGVFYARLLLSAEDLYRHEWVWCKNKFSGHLNAKKAPLKAHESILVFCQGRLPYNPQMTDGHAPTNYAKRVKRSTNYGSQPESIYPGGATTRYPKTVLDFPVVNNDSPDRYHPTQKPVALCEYLIKTYTQPGARVLDNCMGAGTVPVACIQSGRRFIGMELNADYYQAAVTRVTAAQHK